MTSIALAELSARFAQNYVKWSAVTGLIFYTNDAPDPMSIEELDLQITAAEEYVQDLKAIRKRITDA